MPLCVCMYLILGFCGMGQADEAGNLKKLNTKFVELRISCEVVRKKGSKTIEKPSLDGPTARKIVSVAEALVKSISWVQTAKGTDEIIDANGWEDVNIKLWQEWRWLVEAMSVVNPADLTTEQKESFPMHCRRFGLYWRDAFTKDFMKSFYLHTLFHHGPECWKWIVQQNKLSFAMLSTTALELRHLAFGRPAHKRSMRGGGGGRRRKCKETGKTKAARSMIKKIPCNAVSYLTLRELALQDWVELNPRCKKCSQWRRDCECMEPDLDRFQPTRGKRGGADGLKRKYEKTQYLCEKGCGVSFSFFAQVVAHEKECGFYEDTARKHKRLRNQITKGGTDLMELELAGGFGSDHEDMHD